MYTEMTYLKKITKKEIHSIIQALDVPAHEKNKLLSLTPSTYLGLAKKLAKGI